MSTRAIIGIIRPNGTVVGGWQWNDGDEISHILRKYFTNEKDIKELIKQGTWRCLLTPRDNDITWFLERVNDYKLIKVGKCFVAKAPKDFNVQNMQSAYTQVQDNMLVFKNLYDAFGQDINYMYIFNPKTKRWTTYGFRYMTKDLTLKQLMEALN